MDDRASGWTQARLIEALDPSDPDRQRDDVLICQLCPFSLEQIIQGRDRLTNPRSQYPRLGRLSAEFAVVAIMRSIIMWTG